MRKLTVGKLEAVKIKSADKLKAGKLRAANIKSNKKLLEKLIAKIAQFAAVVSYIYIRE